MPLLWLSLAFIAGIPLAATLQLPVQFWLLMSGLAGLSLLLYWLLRRRAPSPPDVPPFTLIPVLLAAAFLGGARYQAIQPNLSDPGFIAGYTGGDTSFIIEGVLVEPPDRRDHYTNLRLKVERIRPLEELIFSQAEGLLLARVPPEEDFRYGDRLRLQGPLEAPPQNESFSYREYLARQGIYAYMRYAQADLLRHDQGSPFYAAIYSLRERALKVVYRLYPDPEASLLAGILLGIETGIPEEVARAFEITGTSHIIAISGFNITIIAGLFTSLFGRMLGYWRGALVAFIAITLYTLLVGADAAVVRAAIMGGLALFARQVGRRQHGLNSLALVAALMALLDPNVLWDVGFQLSFAATLGLVLYAEPLTLWFQRMASRLLPEERAERLAGPVGEFFLFTLAAQLTTLPVIAYHFQRLSLTSLIANPIILPAQPAVMTLGGMAVLLGMVFYPLGQVAAYLAWPFVLFTIRAVELIARIPGGSLALGEIALFWVILFYALLLTWTFAGERIRAWLTAQGGTGEAPIPLPGGRANCDESADCAGLASRGCRP